MELHQIRYFRAVAECGSFTRAAKREHVSQPSLSHQILKLENDLGIKLFARTAKSVKLTPAGQAFLATAESVLQKLQEAESQMREIAGVHAGRVRLGVIPTVAPFFLPNILALFSKQYPRVEVQVTEDSGATLLQLLRDRAVDLSIMPIPVRSKEVVAVELLQERLFAVVCDGHPLEKQKKIKLKQLAGKPFFSLKDGHCFRNDVMAMFERANMTPRIAFESGCFLTILNMVKAGMGVSVVPEMAILQGFGCKFVPIESDRPVRTIGLIRMKEVPMEGAQRLLGEFIQSHSLTSRAATSRGISQLQ